MKTLLTSLVLLLSMLCAPLSAQLSSYGGVQYGYNAANSLVVFDLYAYGNCAAPGSISWVTPDHGESAAFLIEGVTPANIPMQYGATQLVTDILATSAATYNSSAGGSWTFTRVLPNDPALIGAVIFAQMACFFPDNHYAGTSGVRGQIQ